MSSITHHLKISGMTCGGCSSRLASVLNSTKGVLSADISHQDNSGVIITESHIDSKIIIEVIKSAGFHSSN